MAKRERIDIGVNSRLDELERGIFLLKIQYEKYFSGIERIEPLREREDIKRLIRDLTTTHITNTAQKHKYSMLRARFSSLELYIQRNLYQIERGTHPKMQFRANLAEQRKKEVELRQRERQERRARMTALNQRQQEEVAFRAVYNRYVDARSECGQSSEVSFDSIKESLKRQSRQIKSKFNCERVKFRVAIEDGKAKMKAIPVRKEEK